MNILLVRHGDAIDITETASGNDPDRTLTPLGKKKTKQTAKALKNLGFVPKSILTSPLIRAYQTAEVLGQYFDISDKIKDAVYLKPGTAQSKILNALGSLTESTVLIVGHDPDLEKLASSLIATETIVHMILKKSAVCCITFDGSIEAGKGNLEWLLQPQQLKFIANDQ